MQRETKGVSAKENRNASPGDQLTMQSPSFHLSHQLIPSSLKYVAMTEHQKSLLEIGASVTVRINKKSEVDLARSDSIYGPCFSRTGNISGWFPLHNLTKLTANDLRSTE